METQTSNVQTLHSLKFLRFHTDAGILHTSRQNTAGFWMYAALWEYRNVFSIATFWGMVSCIQITLQHQKCLGFFFFFFSDASLSSLRCTLPPSDLSMFPPLSPRLTALEKEALCVRIHNDRWMDWWAGCTLLFPHYRFYWVTLYWCNDWDVWHF